MMAVSKARFELGLFGENEVWDLWFLDLTTWFGCCLLLGGFVGGDRLLAGLWWRD